MHVLPADSSVSACSSSSSSCRHCRQAPAACILDRDTKQGQGRAHRYSTHRRLADRLPFSCPACLCRSKVRLPAMVSHNTLQGLVPSCTSAALRELQTLECATVNRSGHAAAQLRSQQLVAAGPMHLQRLSTLNARRMHLSPYACSSAAFACSTCTCSILTSLQRPGQAKPS